MRSKVLYAFQKLVYAWEVGTKLGVTRQPLHTIWNVVSEEITKGGIGSYLTEVIGLSGKAMYPTLNPQAESNPNAVDRLLVRRLPLPSAKNCHIGDVVVFNHPLLESNVPILLVRRIAAMPGDQMLSDERFEPFLIPFEHCWVLADHPEAKPGEFIDSRVFGPLPFSTIIGRVIYNGYSPQDHGIVVNSPEANVLDEPLLENELSLDRLFSKDTL